MSKVIWKYELEFDHYKEISVPKGAEILCVQVQDGAPCIWALVDDKEEEESMYIMTFGTGHPIRKDITLKNHLGTYQLHGGNLIWHVFEISKG